MLILVRGIMSCFLAEVDISAFDDETMVLPGGVEVTSSAELGLSPGRDS